MSLSDRLIAGTGVAMIAVGVLLGWCICSGLSGEWVIPVFVSACVLVIAGAAALFDVMVPYQVDDEESGPYFGDATPMKEPRRTNAQ